MFPVIYFFFPETARLTLEEIAQNFGEEVAVHLTDKTDEEKAHLDQQLAHTGGVLQPSMTSSSGREGEKDSVPSPVEQDESNVAKAE
jgi:hypothetical protein